MKCRKTKDLTTAYLLGDLDRTIAAEVESHLEKCADCRVFADGLKPTLNLLRETLTSPSDAPEHLDAEHRARILEPQPRRKLKISQMPAAFGIPLRIAALFIATIGLFILILPTYQSARTRSQLTQTAANGRNLIQSLISKETQDIYAPTRFPGRKQRINSEVDAVGGFVSGLGNELAGGTSSAMPPPPSSPRGSEVEVEMMEMEAKNMDRSDMMDMREANMDDFEAVHAAPPPLEPQRSEEKPDMPVVWGEFVGDRDRRDISGDESWASRKRFAGLGGDRRARAKNSGWTGKPMPEPAPKSKNDSRMVPLDKMVEMPPPQFQGTPVPIKGFNIVEPEKPDENKREDAYSRDRLAADVDMDEEGDEEVDDGSETIARAYGVNPFVDADADAFSTFAIDCDTASYTMARRHLQQGRRPPPDTVRTEEFVNFFDYRYPPPRNRLFGIHGECAPSPFGRGLHLLHIGVKGRRLGRDQQRPAVLTFLIDTSGSMNTPDRIGLVRQALEKLVAQLSPRDEVGIVTYGSSARLMLEHTPASEKQAIVDTIENLRISGSTNLESGLLLAYEQAARHFRSGAINRVILLSDGKANLGSDDPEQILKQIEEYRKQGIFCSVFGFGTGSYNDEMLETLANKGDGTYSFVDSEAEVDRVFVKDLDATLQLIAQDAKIQVEFDPHRVVRYRQIGYENRRLRKQDFRNDAVDAGEVGSGQSVTALYELELKGDPNAPIGVVRVRGFDRTVGRVVEIDAPLAPPSVDSFEKASSRFKLAAVAAELAEILRGSPFAAGSGIDDLLMLARPLAQELYLDQHVQELLRLINRARSLK